MFSTRSPDGDKKIHWDNFYLPEDIEEKQVQRTKYAQDAGFKDK